MEHTGQCSGAFEGTDKGSGTCTADWTAIIIHGSGAGSALGVHSFIFGTYIVSLRQSRQRLNVQIFQMRALTPWCSALRPHQLCADAKLTVREIYCVIYIIWPRFISIYTKAFLGLAPCCAMLCNP
jgi:hypothetical protein